MVNNDNELTIEPVNDEVLDLETLITEGTDAYVPLKFVYPNTDKTVGVYVKPLTTQEFLNSTRGGNNVFIDVLNQALVNKNKEPFSLEVLQKLPAGVVMELYKKVSEISGIPTDNANVNQTEMVDRMMGF